MTRFFLGVKIFLGNFHRCFRYQWVPPYNISKIFPRWHCPFNSNKYIPCLHFHYNVCVPEKRPQVVFLDVSVVWYQQSRNNQQMRITRHTGSATDQFSMRAITNQLHLGDGTSKFAWSFHIWAFQTNPKIMKCHWFQSGTKNVLLESLEDPLETHRRFLKPITETEWRSLLTCMLACLLTYFPRYLPVVHFCLLLLYRKQKTLESDILPLYRKQKM